MVEPNGPLPAAVYWRRRALAAGTVVLAVALLAWIIGGLVEADDQHPVRGTGGRVQPSSSSAAPTTTRSSTSVSPTSSSAQPTTQASAPAAPAAPPAPPPQPCQDAVVRVVASPGQPSYPVGARPLLRLEITNVGQAPCTRDVSRRLREIVVVSSDGVNRLWSSNDCYGPPGQDVRVLAPNQALTFSLNWAGRTSAPGCPANRQVVPAGSYLVVGKLGGLAGAPTPIALT